MLERAIVELLATGSLSVDFNFSGWEREKQSPRRAGGIAIVVKISRSSTVNRNLFVVLAG
jgi:hypothetical protein